MNEPLSLRFNNASLEAGKARKMIFGDSKGRFCLVLMVIMVSYGASETDRFS